MATKPIKFLELHYTMTQFLIMNYILKLSLARKFSYFIVLYFSKLVLGVEQGTGKHEHFVSKQLRHPQEPRVSLTIPRGLGQELFMENSGPQGAGGTAGDLIDSYGHS